MVLNSTASSLRDPVQVHYVEKYCWRCHCDLTRQRAEKMLDRVMARLGLKTYNCRRCCARRYRRG